MGHCGRILLGGLMCILARIFFNVVEHFYCEIQMGIPNWVLLNIEGILAGCCGGFIILRFCYAMLYCVVHPQLQWGRVGEAL